MNLIFIKNNIEGKIYVENDEVILEWSNIKGRVSSVIDEERIIYIQHDGKRLGIRVDDEEVAKKTAIMYREVSFNRERKIKEKERNTPLTFTVTKLEFNVFDYFITQNVLVRNKDILSDEEKEIFEKLLKICETVQGYLVTDLPENTTITLNEIAEKYAKEIEKLEKKEEKLQEEIKEKTRQALIEAKKTGKNIPIRIIGGYDGDEISPHHELGWVNIVEVATPEGEIKRIEQPTY